MALFGLVSEKKLVQTQEEIKELNLKLEKANTVTIKVSSKFIITSLLWAFFLFTILNHSYIIIQNNLKINHILRYF